MDCSGSVNAPGIQSFFDNENTKVKTFSYRICYRKKQKEAYLARILVTHVQANGFCY